MSSWIHKVLCSYAVFLIDWLLSVAYLLSAMVTCHAIYHKARTSYYYGLLKVLASSPRI